jgi:hypothetical protein
MKSVLKLKFETGKWKVESGKWKLGSWEIGNKN